MQSAMSSFIRIDNDDDASMLENGDILKTEDDVEFNRLKGTRI